MDFHEHVVSHLAQVALWTQLCSLPIARPSSIAPYYGLALMPLIFLVCVVCAVWCMFFFPLPSKRPKVLIIYLERD